MHARNLYREFSFVIPRIHICQRHSFYKIILTQEIKLQVIHILHLSETMSFLQHTEDKRCHNLLEILRKYYISGCSVRLFFNNTVTKSSHFNRDKTLKLTSAHCEKNKSVHLNIVWKLKTRLHVFEPLNRR